MSFGLYFLTLSPGETWQDAMDRLEEAAATPAGLDDHDLAQWTPSAVTLNHSCPMRKNFPASLIESSTTMRREYSCRCHTAS